MFAPRGEQTVADAGADEPFWVFGYGSLMWEPGFAFQEATAARIWGYHRSLCLLSVRNRGTPERPGLVLALDRGGSCQGLAFRIAPEHAVATRAYLWQREMYTGAYRARTVPLRLVDGRRISALTFVARPDHVQHFRAASLEHAADMVLQGQGRMGTSFDYLRNVVRHLDQLGITDGPLHQVLSLAEARRA